MGKGKTVGLPLIGKRHSLIPACDVDIATLEKLAAAVADLPGVGAFKVGFQLALTAGLPATVKVIRRYSDKPIIYDHQKAATDIPDTAAAFAGVCKDAGITAVILFPLTGPQVLKNWVEACQRQGLGVIVGGLMTHASFLVGEGGFVHDEAPALIYTMAAELGVRDFVVPATKPDFSWSVLTALRHRNVEPIFYSPGLGAQGGDWRTLGRTEAPAWHAIVGRSLYGASDFRAQALTLLKEVPA
jgi:orotidine-5'-phosphate decarboxylase